MTKYVHLWSADNHSFPPSLQRMRWEKSQLSTRLNFQKLQIDNAPIQLVERTSLQKAHSLFSLLSLERAYVTRMGRLVGVVDLTDIRRALEDQTQMAQEADEDEKDRRRNGLGSDASEGLIDVALQPIRARKMAKDSRARYHPHNAARPAGPHPRDYQQPEDVAPKF